MCTVSRITEDAKVAEEAYERIEKMQKTAEQKDEAPRTRGRSRTQPTEKKDPDLSIDLDFDGVDAGVNVEIGSNGVKIDSQGKLSAIHLASKQKINY